MIQIKLQAVHNSNRSAAQTTRMDNTSIILEDDAPQIS